MFRPNRTSEMIQSAVVLSESYAHRNARLRPRNTHERSFSELKPGSSPRMPLSTESPESDLGVSRRVLIHDDRSERMERSEQATERREDRVGKCQNPTKERERVGTR